MPEVTQLLPIYGLTALGAVAFAGSSGAPLPATLLLLAAGALTADGTIGFVQAFLTALVAAVLGDTVVYAAGRVVGAPLIGRARRRFGWGTAARGRVHGAPAALFARWGGRAVWTTRWLFTAAAPSVSFVAGASRYSFLRFIALAAAGEALWAAAYLGLGRAFGDGWEQIGGYASAATLGLAALALLVVAALVGFRAGAVPRAAATAANR
jgi:membrane-associated protein